MKLEDLIESNETVADPNARETIVAFLALMNAGQALFNGVQKVIADDAPMRNVDLFRTWVADQRKQGVMVLAACDRLLEAKKG